MSKKVVETSKTPDGRFIWEIGEVDDMGGGFGCLFIDKSSGSWTRTKLFEGDPVYSGEFFDTREAALAAGKEAI
jgi:hypothetical protein